MKRKPKIVGTARRKLDGKIYTFYDSYLTKLRAKQSAKDLRSNYGQLVRIVRDPGIGWAIYKRKK